MLHHRGENVRTLKQCCTSQTLKEDATETSTLPAQARAAASIAAQNFTELTNMANQQRYGVDPSSTLDMGSLNFIDDMVKHNILGHAAERMTIDVAGMAASALAGLMGAGLTGVVFEDGIGATIAAEGLGTLAMVGMTAGIAVGGVIGVGAFGYGTAVEYSHLNSYATKDSSEISQWIKR
jgi:hypothetical protein